MLDRMPRNTLKWPATLALVAALFCAVPCLSQTAPAAGQEKSPAPSATETKVSASKIGDPVKPSIPSKRKPSDACNTKKCEADAKQKVGTINQQSNAIQTAPEIQPVAGAPDQKILQEVSVLTEENKDLQKDNQELNSELATLRDGNVLQKKLSLLLGAAALLVSLMAVLFTLPVFWGKKLNDLPGSDFERDTVWKVGGLEAIVNDGRAKVKDLIHDRQNQGGGSQRPKQSASKDQSRTNDSRTSQTEVQTSGTTTQYAKAIPPPQLEAPAEEIPSVPVPPQADPPRPPPVKADPLTAYSQARGLGEARGAESFQQAYPETAVLSCVNLEEWKADRRTKLILGSDRYGAIVAIEDAGQILAFPSLRYDYVLGQSLLQGVFKYPESGTPSRLIRCAVLKRSGDRFEVDSAGEFGDA